MEIDLSAELQLSPTVLLNVQLDLGAKVIETTSHSGSRNLKWRFPEGALLQMLIWGQARLWWALVHTGSFFPNDNLIMRF